MTLNSRSRSPSPVGSVTMVPQRKMTYYTVTKQGEYLQIFLAIICVEESFHQPGFCSFFKILEFFQTVGTTFRKLQSGSNWVIHIYLRKKSTKFCE